MAKLDIIIGSVWTVPFVDGQAVVTAGPFGTSENPEFLVVPIYSSREPGFSRSQLDVKVGASESPFNRKTFAAVWNARPILASDLELNLGLLSTPAIEAVRDVYWTSLNGEVLGKDRRLGKLQILRRRRIIRFQELELRRWLGVSARVWKQSQRRPLTNAPLNWEFDLNNAWLKCGNAIEARVHADIDRVHELWSAVGTSYTLRATMRELREVRDISDNLLPTEPTTSYIGSSVCFNVWPSLLNQAQGMEGVWWEDRIHNARIVVATSGMSQEIGKQENVLDAADRDLALAA